MGNHSDFTRKPQEPNHAYATFVWLVREIENASFGRD